MSNKEGNAICEIDDWVLRGMQFGVLVQVLFRGAGASAVGGAGDGVGLCVCVRAFLRDSRLGARGSCWRRCCFGALAQVLLEVTVRAHFCKIAGRVLGGMQFGMLVQVLGAFFARLTAGCLGACSLWEPVGAVLGP